MSHTLHPDASIAAWLADGPTTLSPQRRDDVKSAARRTPQRRLVILPLPSSRGLRLVLVAAALVVLGLAIALGAGSLPKIGPPPSPETPPHAAMIERPWVTLAFDYDIPDGLELVRGMGGPPRMGYVGFASRAGGVAVEEVSRAIAHFTNGQFLGTDAAGFLAGMANNDQFTIGEVSATTLDGRPAFAADVTSGHFDISVSDSEASIGSLSFDHPSRVIVADIDGAIVLVQIWAGSSAELEAWLPKALEFVDSMRFRVERPS